MKINLLRFIMLILLTGSSQLFCAQAEQRKKIEQQLFHFDELPEEAQFHILHMLIDTETSLSELNRDIAHFSRVSKKFYNMTQQKFEQEKIREKKLALSTAAINSIKQKVNAYIAQNYLDPKRHSFSSQSQSMKNQEGENLLTFIVKEHSLHLLTSENVIVPDAYALALDSIKHGVDVNAASIRTGLTPLMAATHDPSLVKLLLVSGAKQSLNYKDITGQTALMFAGEFGNADSIQMLIDAGANINAQSSFGYTPLTYAIMSERVSAVKRLLDRGAKITPLVHEQAQTKAKQSPGNASRQIILKMVEDKMAKDWQKYRPMTIM